MNNTREKFATRQEDYTWRYPASDYLNTEILNRLDQMTKELKQIKLILNMETNDGK